MRKWMALIGVLFSTLLVQASALAKDDVTVVIGFDDMSCGAWSNSSKDPRVREVYLTWFRGFVTGYNFATPKRQVAPEAMPNQDTLALYVDKYCREHPLSIFGGAAFDLVKELTGRK